MTENYNLRGVNALRFSGDKPKHTKEVHYNGFVFMILYEVTASSASVIVLFLTDVDY